MAAPVCIRPAAAADVHVIARHRAEMFSDMGQLAPAAYPALVEQTIAYLRHALPSGEYVGWLAAPAGREDLIVAGAGVQVRRVLPFPVRSGGIAAGRQAIVLNVFTEQAWRRQGLAAMLMARVIEWASASDLDGLVLHASDDGRALYERLGFVPTTEMRYARPLR